MRRHELKHLAPLAIAPPFIMFVVAPLSVYFGNISAIHYGLADVLAPALVLCGASALFLFILLLAASSIKSLFLTVRGLLLGLALAAWVQSHILVWQLGPVTGGPIFWEQWHAHMWLEGFVWLGILSLVLYVSATQKEHVIPAFTQLVFTLGVLSILYSYVTADSHIPERYQALDGNRMEEILTFHPEHNVVIIVLDYFHSGAFEVIARQHPEETDVFTGFIFYANAVSSHPNTAESLPSLFTGEIYLNQQPYRQFLTESYERHSIISDFEDLGWSSTAIAFSHVANYISGAIERNQLFEFFGDPLERTWIVHLQYGLFRLSPTLVKSRMYADGKWILDQFVVPDLGIPTVEHAQDVRFVRLFEKHAMVGEHTSPSFKYYHLHLPHLPLSVNESLEYQPAMQGREDYIRQARGALRLSRAMLDTLKAIGVYESSEIFIISDHGAREFSFFSELEALTSIVPVRVADSARVLFLHKAPYATGSLTYSDAAVELRHLPCLMSKIKWKQRCRDFPLPENSLRRYYYYDGDWVNFVPYRRNMAEIILEGDARRLSAWSFGEHIYSPGDKKREMSRENPFKTDRVELVLGAPITFEGEFAVSMPFLTFGWGAQEAFHRWTVGDTAVLTFSVNPPVLDGIMVRAKAAPYLAAGAIDNQSVRIAVNGIEVATWKMQGEKWYEAVIPPSVIEDDGLVEMKFNISNPAAPADYGLSVDARRLGFALKELLVEELNLAVALDEEMSLLQGGDGGRYLAYGWSGAERDHRWTDGHKAGLQFRLDRKNGRVCDSIKLQIMAHPYLVKGEIDRQEVAVFVNGQYIQEWVMSEGGIYEVVIPSEMLGANGQARIGLNIPHAVAPAGFELSTDPRVLGITVPWFRVTCLD